MSRLDKEIDLGRENRARAAPAPGASSPALSEAGAPARARPRLSGGVRGPASRFIVKASPKRNRLNGGHQCSPGPLARVAEQDADTILAALWRESRSPRSPRPSRGAPP